MELGEALDRILILAGLGVVVYVVLCAIVATYGNNKGFPFFPLFLASILLAPPLGLPIVLLAVAIAGGRKT